MHRHLTALLVLAPTVAFAQRAIDLTGKPIAAIAEPFTKISGVQELSSSLAVATDNMEAKVVLIDFARGTVKQVGAKGQGPNEYRFPSPPIGVPDGAYVFDTYQRRAILVARNGAIAGMKALPDGPLSRARGSDATGHVYFEGSDFDPNTGRFSDSLPVVRWNPATDKVERVARVWSGGRVMIQRKEGLSSMAREITPFPHLDAWVALPDGRLALIRHEPFRIDFASPSGMITHGSPIAVMPIAITARERDWYRERNTPGRMGAMMAGGGTGPQQQGPQWEDAHFPRMMPTFIGADVVSTPEGEIWIPRSFTSVDKARKYDIYDATGKLTGSALLDPNARIVGFGPRSVYVARTNPDDDLVYLSKYAR
jgi:hypothetical protein